MKVLWFSHLIPYPPKSGALLRAYNLLRSVAERHDVDLLAFIQEPLLSNFYASLDEALIDCESNLSEFCERIELLPIEKLRRPLGKLITAGEALFTRHGYMANWLRSNHASTVARKLHAARQYDIVHLDCESLACFRAIFKGTPITLGHHNIESHMLMRRSENLRNLLWKLYFQNEAKKLRAFEHQIAGDFDLHITCSPLDSERLREIMPEARLECIPNGVDIAYFAPQSTVQRRQSLVFVSSMSWYPNVDAALFLLQEIWPRVLSKVPSASLDIVGPGAPPSVEQCAALWPSVTLHGYVEDIRPIVDSAALYVCPVRDGGGTKLKILDAMAMGKCIVAHPIACEGIAVTPGKNVNFATTPDQFADVIAELFDDMQRRTDMGVAARSLAKSEYAFDKLGSEFSKLLESVAAR